MFDLIAEAVAAWNQVGFLIGGGVFAGIGLLLLGNRLYWRFGASRTTGTVVGVRRVDARFNYPVYNYKSLQGETIEATSNVGSNSSRGMNTGRPVELMVFERDPYRAAEAGSYVLEVVSTIFVVLGIGLAHFALTAWPVTRITWIVLAAMMGYGVIHLVSVWRPSGKRPTLSAWKQQKRERLEATPVVQVEDLALPTATGIGAKVNPVIRAIILIVGIASLALSVYITRNLVGLQAAGERAPGTIVRLVSESGANNNSTYHSVVRFSTPAGDQIEFTDKIGTNPPAHHSGDAVTVLYLPDSPERTAIIDRRIWNWLPSAGVFLFGAIFTVAGVRLRSEVPAL